MRSQFVPIVTNRLKIRELSKNYLELVFHILGPETSGGRVFEKKTVSAAERW